MFSFQRSNNKLNGLEKLTGCKVYTFSLLSGWSCPFAKECLSKVTTIEGRRKIKDGPHTQFRCFSASQEALFASTYNDRMNNLLEVMHLDYNDIVEELSYDIPDDARIIRLHVGGDFFNEDYFRAWIAIAEDHPDILFYAYTKSLSYWIKNKPLVDDTPNFILTASYGGRHDNLIKKYRLRYAKVIFKEDDAGNLPIDHDDRHACLPEYKKQSFCLLLHGIQPTKSAASQALIKLNGKGSYGKNRIQS